MTLEISVEKAAVTAIESRGFFAVKLGFCGLPDRMILGPNRFVAFLEFKRPKGGVVGAAQKIWVKRLAALGWTVHFPKSKAEALEALDREIEHEALRLHHR